MTWLEQPRTVLRTPALGVWCLFLLTSPIYVFESGLPQPGDAQRVCAEAGRLQKWLGGA